jgi:hypothetical protein
VVSLHEFNELCILPRTDWKFRLVAKQLSDDPALVSPFLLENQERESLIVNGGCVVRLICRTSLMTNVRRPGSKECW